MAGLRKFRRCSGCLAARLEPLQLPGIAADDYPSRLVKVILPFPPGSTLDALARVDDRPDGAEVGPAGVIENVTGGGGNIAMIGSRARRPTATP